MPSVVTHTFYQQISIQTRVNLIGDKFYKARSLTGKTSGGASRLDFGFYSIEILADCGGAEDGANQSERKSFSSIGATTASSGCGPARSARRLSRTGRHRTRR